MDAEKNTLCCPYCGSTHLSVEKKGFGLGKFAVGSLVTLPLLGTASLLVGTGAGSLGRKNQIVYCLQCGRKLKPGSWFSSPTTVEQYNLRNSEFGVGNTRRAMILKALEEGKINVAKATAMLKNEQAEPAQEKENTGILCDNCGAEIQDNMKFCPQCGATRKKSFFCPYCNTEFVDCNIKFCSNCGNKVVSPDQELLHIPQIPQKNTLSVEQKISSVKLSQSNSVFAENTPPKPITPVVPEVVNAKMMGNASIFGKKTFEQTPLEQLEHVGCVTWIAAFYLPYFFVFSKQKMVKRFSIIWLLVLIFFGVCSASFSQNNKSSINRGNSAPQNNRTNNRSTTASPTRSVTTTNTALADIVFFSDLPLSVRNALKEIGVSECFGTELTRRKDLEDSADMRCYRIIKCFSLPKGCNDTIYLYMKNNMLHEVSYNGRVILGEGIQVHVKQAAVDFHYKYVSHKLWEINELLQEGWTPSNYYSDYD